MPAADYSPASNLVETLRAAGAVAAAGTTTEPALAGFGRYRTADIVLTVTAAATEAGDTLDVYVDTSFDGGLTWVNLIHFPQVLGNGGAKKFVARVGTVNPGAAPVDVSADAAVNVVRALGFGDQLRVRHVVVDVVTTSNVSFNFHVKGTFKS